MPVITPPTIDRVLTTERMTHAKRRIAQIVGSPVGQTLYKYQGTWRLGQHVSNDILLASDPVLLGGHLYWVDPDTYDEIVADGITPPVVDQIGGPYPAEDLYPSEDLFPA